ncbi:MAG: B12-binding domain-containing radical SAM protein [Clostridia bacterium]|nr:B12-binding domain-containing radical SAM protein [Clostridia bacterium]
MKVLLTTLNSKYIHSNLAIRYLNNYCAGIENVNFILQEYTINDTLDYIIGDIYFKDVEVVCFSCYIWNIQQTLVICRHLKMVDDSIKIILGGPEVSYDCADLLREHDFIDFIVKGEGEESFRELITCISKDQSVSDVAGICFRDKDRVLEAQDREPIQNLDDIPFPYQDIDKLIDHSKLIYYECSRGCPYKCAYCLSSASKGVRFFSLDRVKKDLMTFIRAGVDKVKFVDRTFNCNMDYALQVFSFLIENSDKTSFHFEINGDLIDDRMIKVISKAPPGLFQFEIGVQSTNPKTLESINRRMDFKLLSDNVKKVYDMRNIHQHLDLIAGLPYETYHSFSQSFNDIYMLKPDRLQLGFLKLLKGTDMRRMAREHSYVYTDFPPYEVMSNVYMSYREIAKLKMIEDLVEKYWNSHAFDCSVKYIIDNYFDSPFKFYEEFSEFYFAKGYAKVSHSRKMLYKILLEFYITRIHRDAALFCDILKFDYLRQNKTGKLPEFIKAYSNHVDIKNRCFEFLKSRENVEKFLPHFIGKSAKHIIRHVHFEQFENYVAAYIQGCNIEDIRDKKVVILFDYSSRNILDQADYKVVE